MALPKLMVPEFETTIPSTQQKIRFRPFLVKEEKVLYMALEGKDAKEMGNAITKILESCIVTEGVNVKELAFFDLEFLFLKLRSKSVGEEVDLKIRHLDTTECSHYTDIKVNLDEVKVNFPEGLSDRIMLTDTTGIQLKYPALNMLDKVTSSANTEDPSKVFDLLSECVVCVFDNDQVYDNFTKKEIREWIEGLSKPQFEKMAGFFNNLPKVQHKVTYTCPKCGKEETVVLEGLQNFFL